VGVYILGGSGSGMVIEVTSARYNGYEHVLRLGLGLRRNKDE
jgi:hypothetical protein